MTKQPFPSDQQDKFMLRLPAGMRDRIKAAADINNRSMNSEIIARLENSFDANGSAVGVSFNINLSEVDIDDIEQKLDLVTKRLQAMGSYLKPGEPQKG